MPAAAGRGGFAAVIAAAALAALVPLPGRGETLGILVPGRGAEEAFAYCTACHSERIVAQQGLTRERWETLLEWMVEEQGMHMPDETDRTLLLDYLTANYGPDRPNFPSGGRR